MRRLADILYWPLGFALMCFVLPWLADKKDRIDA